MDAALEKEERGEGEGAEGGGRGGRGPHWLDSCIRQLRSPALLAPSHASYGLGDSGIRHTEDEGDEEEEEEETSSWFLIFTLFSCTDTAMWA